MERGIKDKFTSTIRIDKVSYESRMPEEDQLAIEEPLEILLQYWEQGELVSKNIAVTMRTPGHDEELAVGFLFTEGIIKQSPDVKKTPVSILGESKVTVQLMEGVVPRLENADRNFYTTSSCGVCGKSSINAIRTHSHYEKSDDDIRVDSSVFYKLPSALRLQQQVFDNTGGLHASALFDINGNFILLREDVGRHNALDKVIGSLFMSGQMPIRESILVLSGRASFELIQKAAMAGIRVVAAIGAPSSLAVETANEFNMTLVGFLRDDRFNIYSESHRVV